MSIDFALAVRPADWPGRRAAAAARTPEPTVRNVSPASDSPFVDLTRTAEQRPSNEPAKQSQQLHLKKMRVKSKKCRHANPALLTCVTKGSGINVCYNMKNRANEFYKRMLANDPQLYPTKF
ncbi:MAG: hypothetical protein HC834_05205 [Rhodospirillales bacterium]|nr:hypothetical protein [Rhodospirillales bacterium]